MVLNKKWTILEGVGIVLLMGVVLLLWQGQRGQFAWSNARQISFNSGIVNANVRADGVYMSWGPDATAQKFDGADPASFVGINDYYAKDVSHVWYINAEQEAAPVLLPGVDPTTFVVDDPSTPYTFSRDATHVFWYMSALPTADPSTFSVLSYRGALTSYAKDAKHVYFGGVIIPQADPKSFSIIDIDEGRGHVSEGGYSKDASRVYFNEKLIPDADPATFVVFSAKDGETGYAKDKSHIFFYEEEVSDAQDSVHKLHDDTLSLRLVYGLEVLVARYDEMLGRTMSIYFLEYQRRGLSSPDVDALSGALTQSYGPCWGIPEGQCRE